MDPLNQVLALFHNPLLLVAKRKDKLLDYDSLRHDLDKLDKLTEPERLLQLREQCSMAKKWVWSSCHTDKPHPLILNIVSSSQDVRGSQCSTTRGATPVYPECGSSCSPPAGRIPETAGHLASKSLGAAVQWDHTYFRHVVYLCPCQLSRCSLSEVILTVYSPSFPICILQCTSVNSRGHLTSSFSNTEAKAATLIHCTGSSTPFRYQPDHQISG